MKDCIGNHIEKGAILSWTMPEEIKKRGNLLCNVLAVSESDVRDAQGRVLPQMLVISIQLPISDGGNPAGRDKEMSLTDFLCVVNPSAQALVEGLAGGNGVSKLLKDGPVPLPRKM